MKEKAGEYKLAIYYAPLSSKLNLEPLENIPPEAYKKTSPQKAATQKPAPLLGD